MIKKISFLLLLCLLPGCSLHREPGEAGFRIMADKVDPIDREFPGGRGTDQLIVYTPAFGETTGTNKYGLEAVVVDGFIRSVGGNNSRIPENGYVISGHGKMSAWISRRLYPGIEVIRDEKMLRFRVSGRTKLLYVRHLIRQARANFQQYGKDESSIDETELAKIQSEIGKLEHQISEAGKPWQTGAADRLLEYAREVYYKSFPSRKHELRAVWYRLWEKSPQELEQTIQRMAAIGFNAICPETIYGGYAIYPDAHADLQQNPQFAGWDPLKELQRLCQKYRLKLIPWVWVFFVGKENSPLVQSHDDWLGRSRNGENFSRLEKGYHYFCPSRQQVTRFWLEVYRKLLQNYRIDGLQLDYIRYPVSLPYELGYCYCDSCRAKFQKIAGVDPLKIDPDQNPQQWQKWNQFRIEQINEFVRQVAELVEKVKPGVKLSADVFPLFEESIDFKFQDWGFWLDQNYLDEIFTMSYTADANQVNIESRFLAEHLPRGKRGYVGLGPFLGFRPETLLQEIDYVRQSGANGICLFSFGSLKPEQIEALKKGPFRSPAVP